MNWLFKEEPSSYSFEQFTKDGRAVWAGVKNPLAQKHLRGVKKGDRVFYYHTGNQKAIVGVATAIGDAYPDPKDKARKAFVVAIQPERPLARVVTLAEIKASKAFASFPLTRLPRLSVMPVSDAEWKEIERMSRG
jgi:predicted RNA-binding protein with PUA-like domain